MMRDLLIFSFFLLFENLSQANQPETEVPSVIFQLPRVYIYIFFSV